MTAAVAPAYLGGDFPRAHSGNDPRAVALGCVWGSCSWRASPRWPRPAAARWCPRDQAVAFPVSPTTDHLGALLLAPLNIAWIMQAWLLLGADVVRPRARRALWAYEIPVLLWIVAATALAQVVGWLAEGVRRGRHGIATFRVLVVALRRWRSAP